MIVTVMEENLLSALEELQESALVMTSGAVHSSDDMERFSRAIEWSKRIIVLTKRTS